MTIENEDGKKRVLYYTPFGVCDFLLAIGKGEPGIIKPIKSLQTGYGSIDEKKFPKVYEGIRKEFPFLPEFKFRDDGILEWYR